MNLKSLAVIGLVAFPLLAQAECGWLLLSPPHVPDPWRRPISEWTYDRAYDSADACEKQRDYSREGVLKALTETKTDWLQHLEAFETWKARVLAGPESTTGAFMLARLSLRCLPASQVPVR